MVETSNPMNRPADGTAVEDGRTVTTTTPFRTTDYGADVVIEQSMWRPRNRVQWGPVAAGTATALVTMLLLSVLGLAVGTSAFEPGTDVSDWGTAAGIWGGVSAIIALFLGGWVAARSAAVSGQYAGLLNGFLSGAATLLIVLWLTTTGITNLLGFIGNNVADIAAVATQTLGTDADVTTDQATYDRVRDGAWGTLFALVIALAAASVGGLLGHHNRRDFDQAVA